MDLNDIIHVKTFSNKRSMLVAIITDAIIAYHSLLDTAKTPQTNRTNGAVALDGRLLG